MKDSVHGANINNHDHCKQKVVPKCEHAMEEA